MPNKALIDFFYTLFDPTDEICLSYNQLSYASVPLSEYLNEKGTITLYGQRNGQITKPYIFLKKELELVAINAVKGPKLDNNVIKYRSFLIEIDNMALTEQVRYILNHQVPISVAVYSGNKSIHFGIVLEQPLPSKTEYSFYAAWLLNILKKADQNTKNPTRSIRIPFVKRKNTGKMQTLLYNNGRISNNDFISFLNLYPELAPTNYKPNERLFTADIFSKISEQRLKELKEKGAMAVDLRALPTWALKRLKLWHEGKLKQMGYSRNNTVFSIAFELFKLGYTYDIVLLFMQEWAIVEPDFTFKEIETAVLSALKQVKEKYGK